MHASKISTKVVSELQRQATQELSAAHGYLALSLWCEDQNLKGFGRFFAKQRTEEHGHAAKITAHLIDRGILPELGAIAAPTNNFKSILEAAQHAQAMEIKNTQGINSVYEAA